MKNRLAWFSFLLICIIWGTTYLFIKIGVGQMEPFYFAGIRQLSAGIILVGFVLLFQSKKIPPKAIIIQHAIAGILLITFGNGLVTFGETHISSGLAAILVSTTPLWTAIINEFRSDEQRLSGMGYLALGLGLAGILGIFSNSLGGHMDTGWLLGVTCTMGATFAWIWGSIIVGGKTKGYNIFAVTGIQMLSGGVFLMIISLLFEKDHSISFDSSGWIAMLALIFAGSIIAMVAYTHALSHLPLQVVTMYAFINPIVALIVGKIFLDEELTLRTVLFSCLIIVAVILLNLKVSKRKKKENLADSPIPISGN